MLKKYEALNIHLYKYRKNKGYSIFKAARMCHIPFFILMNIERGYIYCNDNFKHKIAKGYNLSLGELNIDSKQYPEYIDLTDSDKKVKKKTKFYNSRFARMFFTVLFAGSLVLAGFGIKGIVDFAYHPEIFYSEEINNEVHLIETKGEEHLLVYSYSKTNEKKQTVTASVDRNKPIPGWIDYYYDYNYQNPTSKTTVDDKITYIGLGVTTSPAAFYLERKSTSNNERFVSVGRKSDEYIPSTGLDYKITRAFVYKDDGTEVEITDFKSEEYDQVNTWTAEVMDASDGLFAPLLKDLGVKTSFITHINQIVQCNILAQGVFDQSFGFLVASILYILFYVAYLIYLYSAFNKKQKTNRIGLEVQKTKDGFISHKIENSHEKNRVLTPNWKFRPFLKEEFIKILTIIILAAGSILSFVVTSQMVGLFNYEYSYNTLTYFASLSSVLIPVGTIIYFFTKCESFLNSENPFEIAFKNFIYGFIFYIVECSIFLRTRIFFANVLPEDLVKTVLSLMPGNIFWGFGCLVLFMAFLFYQPRSNNKLVKISYRLCALLPIAYIVVGFSIAVVYPDISPFVKILFSNKNLIPIIFSLIYVFICYLYNSYIASVYQYDDFLRFKKGSKYFFTKNVIASIAITILILFAFGVSYIPNNIFVKNGYDSTNIAYALLLVPFILLYHPRIESRNTTSDLVLNACTLVAQNFTLIAYLIIIIGNLSYALRF